MALDTREKRMAASGVGRPWMRARDAVGATDEQSRINSGSGYGGNALSPVVAGVNTREKRMSATGAGRPWMRARDAVGATDEQSRMNSGNAYGGNALSPVVGGVPVRPAILGRRGFDETALIRRSAA